MHTLARTFRAAQFTAHDFHQRVTGRTFFEDHEFLGELYGAYETAYDSIIERMIGLKMPVSPSKVTNEAARMATAFESRQSPEDMFGAVYRA